MIMSIMILLGDGAESNDDVKVFALKAHIESEKVKIKFKIQSNIAISVSIIIEQNHILI